MRLQFYGWQVVNKENELDERYLLYEKPLRIRFIDNWIMSLKARFVLHTFKRDSCCSITIYSVIHKEYFLLSFDKSIYLKITILCFSCQYTISCFSALAQLHPNIQVLHITVRVHSLTGICCCTPVHLNTRIEWHLRKRISMNDWFSTPIFN